MRARSVAPGRASHRRASRLAALWLRHRRPPGSVRCGRRFRARRAGPADRHRRTVCRCRGAGAGPHAQPACGAHQCLRPMPCFRCGSAGHAAQWMRPDGGGGVDCRAAARISERLAVQREQARRDCHQRFLSQGAGAARHRCDGSGSGLCRYAEAEGPEWRKRAAQAFPADRRRGRAPHYPRHRGQAGALHLPWQLHAMVRVFNLLPKGVQRYRKK